MQSVAAEQFGNQLVAGMLGIGRLGLIAQFRTLFAMAFEHRQTSLFRVQFPHCGFEQPPHGDEFFLHLLRR